MEGNPQQVQAPPPWPPYNYVPAKPQRRWLPVAIISAAIVIAAALIAMAVIMKGGNDAPAAAPSVAPTTAAAADSSTCDAWKVTKPALDSIPPLPTGWDWNTPNIDTLIANNNAAVTRALDLFEPKIADQPADVASAARTYVEAKRTAMRKLVDHSLTSVDALNVNAAVAQLDQLCGTR